MGWTREDASYLLMRAGLGGSIHQMEALYALGRQGAIARLLDFDSVADPAWDLDCPVGIDASVATGQQDVLAMLYRLLASTHPLQSRLTWFWLDHFAPAIRLTGRAPLDRQLCSLHQHAAGPYKAFLPGMYRDGIIKGHLVGPVTENPARASEQAGMRDITPKSVVYLEGDTLVARPETAVSVEAVSLSVPDRTRIIQRLFDRPDTMRDVCSALCRGFVGPFTDDVEVTRLTQVWRRSEGNITAVMNALLRGYAFWDVRVRGGLFKGALEFAAGLVQRLDLTLDRALLTNMASSLARMGHWLLDEDADEIGRPLARVPEGSGLMQRYAFARHAVFGTDPVRVVSRLTEAMPRRQAPQSFITLLAQRLGIAKLSAHTRALVTDHLGSGEVTGGTQGERVLGAVYLLVCSPEYQRC